MNGLFPLGVLLGFSLGWLACWLIGDGRRQVIAWLSDMDVADELDRDYGYDSRTGERSDR